MFVDKYDLISVSEAAKILGTSHNTIRRLADSGKLRCFRMTNNSYRKLIREEVLEYRKSVYQLENSEQDDIKIQLQVFDFESLDDRKISNMKKIKAKAHPSHYLMHKYWGRKAHNVVENYIQHYTKEGDTVLDPFMGSGIVPIESAKSSRKGIGIDINPMSKFIAENTVSDVNLTEYKDLAFSIISELESELSYLYDTFCPKCGQKAKIEIAIWENDTLVSKRINCRKDGIVVAEIEESDRDDIEEINSIFNRLNTEGQLNFPKERVLRYVKRSGKESIDELFTPRALIILSQLMHKIKSVSNVKIRKLILFTFTSMLANVSNMLPGDKTNAIYKSGWVISKFWTPKIHTERNIFHCFKLRVNAIYKGKKELIGIDDSLIELYTQDSTNLQNIANESVDYIFTDPPYGESIAYLALSQFWNSWLCYDVDYTNEIIIDPYRQKGYEDFNSRIFQSFEEMYRVLKDKHYLSFTFHSRDLNVWKGIMDAVLKAGFHLQDINLQEQAVSSGTQGINRFNTLTGDFVYTFVKDTTKKVNWERCTQIEAKEFIISTVSRLISKNNGLTPSKLYELLIPLIVREHAYCNEDGTVIDIEKLLRENFEYIENKDSKKLGDKFQWIKR